MSGNVFALLCRNLFNKTRAAVSKLQKLLTVLVFSRDCQRELNSSVVAVGLSLALGTHIVVSKQCPSPMVKVEKWPVACKGQVVADCDTLEDY